MLYALLIVALTTIGALLVYLAVSWLRQPKYNLPPGPEPQFLVGSAPLFQSGPFHLVFKKLHEEYGPITSVRLGPVTRFVAISDPELVKQAFNNRNLGLSHITKTTFARFIGENSMVAIDGPQWQMHRKLIRPIFFERQLRLFSEFAVKETSLFRNIVREHLTATNGASMDVCPRIRYLTFDINGWSAFGHDFGQQRNPDGRLSNALNGLMKHLQGAAFIPFPSLWAVFHPFLNVQLRKDRAILEEFVNGLISTFRQQLGSAAATEKDGRNLLEMLIVADDKDDSSNTYRFNNREIMDEIITFIFGGFETTTGTILWTLYHLAQYPDIQDQIQQEIMAEIGDNVPEFDDLTKFKALNRAMLESARINPVAIGFGRGVYADIKLGGYDVPKGSVVSFDTYTIQRDPNIYPDPEKFDPDRWLTMSGPTTYKYMPFGGGHRACVGQSFASMMMTTILAMIIQQFRFSIDPAKPYRDGVAITWSPAEMWLIFKPRKSLA